MKKEINTESLIHNLFDLENITILTGTGLAKACGGKTMDDVTKTLLEKIKSITDEDVLSWKKKYLEVSKPNFEDFFNALNVKKRYLDSISKSDGDLNETISRGKEAVFDACSYVPTKQQIVPLFKFLRSLTERKAGLARPNLFSLNYDLLIEHACDQLGVIINDGFEGSLDRKFNSSQFDIDYFYPSGSVNSRSIRCERVLNLIKLHGSINWTLKNNGIIKTQPEKENMFIYPSQDKLEDTLLNPFNEMFRRFSLSNKRYKNGILVIGYGFLDSHVNNIILQGLEQPNSFMVVVDPNIDGYKNKFSDLDVHLDKVHFVPEKFEDFCEKYLPSSLSKNSSNSNFEKLADTLISILNQPASSEADKPSEEPDFDGIFS